ncbi:hypothetical protein ACFWHT_12330 [Microbacterium sp. NPDC058342]|uniref:hypothetical protein n=1 Tax=Microbacterium sp. NPDC058342 TaxID=3346454 RepID=UPI003656F697
MDDRSKDDDAVTTHASWGAGNPHLRISRDGEDRSVLELTMDEATLGSAAGGTVVLAGTEPVHASIVHDDRDEYVLTMHGPGEMNASSEPDHDGVRTEILRTGSRFTLGDWTLVFGREEYADHGRPFGGREGGELSDQPPQPQRPDYAAERAGQDGDDRGQEVKDG